MTGSQIETLVINILKDAAEVEPAIITGVKEVIADIEGKSTTSAAQQATDIGGAVAEGVAVGAAVSSGGQATSLGNLANSIASASQVVSSLLQGEQAVSGDQAAAQ